MKLFLIYLSLILVMPFSIVIGMLMELTSMIIFIFSSKVLSFYEFRNKPKICSLKDFLIECENKANAKKDKKWKKQ